MEWTGRCQVYFSSWIISWVTFQSLVRFELERIQHGGICEGADVTCMHAELLQCPTLCDPTDCSAPCCSVHGILPEGILEWVDMPASRGCPPPGDLPNLGIKSVSPCLLHCRQILSRWATREAWCQVYLNSNSGSPTYYLSFLSFFIS